MGLFDLTIKKELQSEDKNKVLKYLKDTLCSDDYKYSTEDKTIIIENFKAKNALLKYNLTVSNENDGLYIEGELQQVWILTILIILSILFTQGIGVILIVAVTYYQKVFTSKYLNMLIINSD